MQLSQKIKKLRERENLSQASFGEKIGVKTNTIWRWETGQATPQTKILQKICDVFNIALSSLVDDTSEIIDSPVQKGSDFSVKVGTQTMTLKQNGKEIILPYNEEKSLEIIKEFFSGNEIFIPKNKKSNISINQENIGHNAIANVN